jgi:RAD50-interacting protein 1
MASLVASRNSELDSRVRDYLDDKLQTPADFEGLDALLQQARNQQELLKKQVRRISTGRRLLLIFV